MAPHGGRPVMGLTCDHNDDKIVVKKSSVDTFVKAQVNSADKDIAAAVLKELGLNLSDLIRLVIVQTAKTKRLPVDLTLSPECLSAVLEVEERRAQRASSSIASELPSG